MAVKKVLLFALESIDNIGEELLRESTEYIVKQAIDEVDVVFAQLRPHRRLIPKRFIINYILGAVLLRIAHQLRGEVSYKVKDVAYGIAYSSYYSHLISKTNKVILPVGMLKFATQDFSYLFYLINRQATKHHKDVLMSAMSPQRAEDKDWRYHQLVKAVNQPSVKMVTTRDGVAGVEIIKKDYLRRDIVCRYVGDPALWIPEVYRIKKMKNISDVPYVGINIIRKGIFKDYNNASTDEHLRQVYSSLIHLLERRQWRWSVFCNGMKGDWLVLKEIQKEIGFSDSHIAMNYDDGRSYSEMISKFDVVFGARLHSCITSVAVGTPVVGFIWEEKLKYFSKTIGIEKFFLDPSSMTAEKIVGLLEEAYKENWDYSKRDELKPLTLESIRQFLTEIY